MYVESHSTRDLRHTHATPYLVTAFFCVEALLTFVKSQVNLVELTLEFTNLCGQSVDIGCMMHRLLLGGAALQLRCLTRLSAGGKLLLKVLHLGT